MKLTFATPIIWTNLKIGQVTGKAIGFGSNGLLSGIESKLIHCSGFCIHWKICHGRRKIVFTLGFVGWFAAWRRRGPPHRATFFVSCCSSAVQRWKNSEADDSGITNQRMNEWTNQSSTVYHYWVLTAVEKACPVPTTEPSHNNPQKNANPLPSLLHGGCEIPTSQPIILANVR